MKRRILLVDDEVAVLLTLKVVLEISGFDVDTATSAREGKSRIKHREYEMIITDMRMEGERAGEEVIQAAKEAPYKPAIALLTAFPVDEDELSGMGADEMLVKPMHTRKLLQQLETLYSKHHGTAPKSAGSDDDRPYAAKPEKKVAAKKAASPAKKAVAKKPASPAAKKLKAKPVAKKAATKPTARGTAKRAAAKKVAAKKK